MKQSREQQLKDLVFKGYTFDYKPVFEMFRAITLHQDQIAWNLSEREIYHLGALIKVAGMYGVDITVKGKCGEEDAKYSGENTKEEPPNKG